MVLLIERFKRDISIFFDSQKISLLVDVIVHTYSLSSKETEGGGWKVGD
jgi:hypothetical protein